MVTIVYFGTDQASAELLQSLISTQELTILAVVTQPDRPIGRKQILTPSPVKKTAANLGVPIFTPEKLTNFPISTLPKADLFLVFAYGLIIPKKILDLSRHGTLNVHPSLLPKYRGPSPVGAAILNNETETGVSIMLLDEKMDHGPILLQEKVAILPTETAPALLSRLIGLAATFLPQVINSWLNKKITAKVQDDAAATYSKLLTREDGKINWNQPAPQIYNQWRAYCNWPGIWTTWHGKRLKLLRVAPATLTLSPGHALIQSSQVYIGAKNGSLEIFELQLEGEKPLETSDFVLRHKSFNTAMLGT